MDGDFGKSGLPKGDILNAFVEAIIERDLSKISVARSAIISSMGIKALVDSAATVAAFNAYPRMADATGIPLEDNKKEMTSEMRKEFGMERLRFEE